MGTRRRTPDLNGDGNGDGSEESSGDGNGDDDNGNGNGNENRIREGGREAKKRMKPQKSCRRRARNEGDTGGKRKNVEKKGWFSSCQPRQSREQQGSRGGSTRCSGLKYKLYK